MIKKIISKKGSHVGVVVSFVIFVTFLVFLYTIIQPVTVREKDKSYILDYITLNLIGNSTMEVTSVTIEVLESSGNKDCINVQNIDEEVIPSDMRDQLIIKNSSGDSLNYQEQGQGLEIETGQNFIGIVRVYYSEGIIGSQTTLTGCNPKPTTVGVIKTYEEIFKTKLYELNESYYADYEGLKIELGIPEGTEFNFYILDSLRNIIISAKNYEPPTDRSVFVQETPIQYIDENGNKMFGFLVVEVW